MICNTCLRECEPALTEIHKEGLMPQCAACAEEDPISRAVLMGMRQRVPSSMSDDGWNCPRCFAPNRSGESCANSKNHQ